MKLTQLLYKQHIGKAIKYLWYHQRDRRIPITRTEQILASMNIPVQDANQFILEERQKLVKRKIITFEQPIKEEPQSKDCFMFGDRYVLQAGVPQACLLTKTLKIEDDLPEKVKNLIADIPDNINNLLQRFVYTSVLYDAEQVALPKLKDPERPAWVFPRSYGISGARKMRNVSKKFLQLCESLKGLDVAQYRSVVDDGLLSMCIEKESNFLQFSMKMDIMMTSSEPLTAIADGNIDNQLDMPDIYPLKYLVGVSKSNVYESDDQYPIAKESPLTNVHTIFIHHDPHEVINITELPVIEDQIHARSMIKAFAVAATCARQRFGLNIKDLPEPVVVQCVQSDGQNFHFSVYQLNTLDINGTQGTRNFWWSEPTIKLYRQAHYNEGIPCLEGYNSKVFKRYLAFYENK